MPKPRLNVNSVKQRLFEKFNGKYEFVDFIEYHDAKQKEKIKCNECGNNFTTSISALLFENHVCYCPTCKKKKRKRDFVEKVLSEGGVKVPSTLEELHSFLEEYNYHVDGVEY